jgi:SpoIID/LytB domain protein
MLAVLSVVSALALLPAASAGASPSEFTFYGSGFGHGLGMSQWGAYGLAQEGWGEQEILEHYYSSTRVDRATDTPNTLRIGLVQGKDKLRVEAQSGKVDLLLGDPKTGEVVASIPRGETWTVRLAEHSYKILDASGHVVGDVVGDESTNLFAVYEPNDALVKVPEALHTYNRGWIEFNIYNCGSNCSMRLILELGPEEYLYGLGEVPSSWPMSAMEAQAVAARSYALGKASYGQHRSGCNCALYASSYDQVYAGWDKEGGVDGDRWVRAVDATAGRVVTYKGDVIQAYYMSSSGGHTEDNENVWGGTPIEYLRGVCDPGDYTTENPSATWTVTYTAEQVTKKLNLGIGTVTGFSNIGRGVSGRIVTVTVKGESGTASISGSTLRSALALRDDRVWINQDRLVTGDIRVKYDALDCSPGLPTSREVLVAGGARQTFQNATIFSKEGPGSHSLWGPVLDFYLSKGGPGGKLGFPTSDVRTLASGKLRANFEQGVVTCGPSGGCSIS